MHSGGKLKVIGSAGQDVVVVVERSKVVVCSDLEDLFHPASVIFCLLLNLLVSLMKFQIALGRSLGILFVSCLCAPWPVLCLSQARDCAKDNEWPIPPLLHRDHIKDFFLNS